MKINRCLKSVFVLMLFILLLNQSMAQPGKISLSESYPLSILQNSIIKQQNYHPFPRSDERTSWNALPENARRLLIERGERYLNYAYPALPATLFLEFARDGNRENFQKPQRERRDALASLLLGECVEGTGRFFDDIVNGIWTICEESYWGVPAHLSMQQRGYGLPDPTEHTVDLFAAETGGLLAWTSYLLGEKLDRISPLIRERIQLELEKRILTPCLERDDFWWMGFRPDEVVNNWNPWVNSNWLTIVLLNEKDETRRIGAVSKIMKSLDVFINSYPEDGGCDEGPVYWNRAAASLFDCLELLYSATNGRINIYNEPLIHEMGRYIYRVHIADRYFINFADASAKVNLESDLAFRYGKRIGDDRLQAFGAFFSRLRRQDEKFFEGSVGRQLPAIFNFAEINAAAAAQPLLRDVWMPGIQVMTARSHNGTPNGLYVAAKGGHNAESHNHNDIGNFIIYLDGLPMIIDVGVETYTKKTFSPRRYEIWTMQSAFHNLPKIDGVMQHNGREFAARNVEYTSDDAVSQLKLDIAGAYPAEAGIDQWTRTVRLNRGDNVLVIDEFGLNRQAQQIQMTLMTACDASISEPGIISLINTSGAQSAQLNISFDAQKLKAVFEEIRIDDPLLQSVWGDRITRILLTTTVPVQNDTWTLKFSP